MFSYGNMNRQTCIHKHVLQLQNRPLKSFLDNEIRKLGANQKLKSGICRGRIRNLASTAWNPESNTVLDNLTWAN